MDWMDDLMDKTGLSKKTFSFDELFDDSDYPYLATHKIYDVTVLFDEEESGVTVRSTMGSNPIGYKSNTWNSKEHWTTISNVDNFTDEEKDNIQELVEEMEIS